MPRPLSLQEAILPNPSRGVWIAGAVGVGLVVAAGAWWIWGRKGSAPGGNTLGQVACASTAYFGPVDVDDYVVVTLQSTQGHFQEATWGQVTAKAGTMLTVELVGETAEGEVAKPLGTSQHGFAVGDTITVDRKCIVDRFRPGQTWRTICGPSLVATGHVAISPAQASLLGIGDRAQLVIRSESGETEPVWVTIDNVSQGVQSLRGLVGAVPSETLGPQPGDVIEFLRDCVIDAEFKTGQGAPEHPPLPHLGATKV
jgi:hypothetical protein